MKYFTGRSKYRLHAYVVLLKWLNFEATSGEIPNTGSIQVEMVRTGERRIGELKV